MAQLKDTDATFGFVTGSGGAQGVQLVAAPRFCQNHGKSVATGGGSSSGVAALKKAANVQMTARSVACMTFPGP